MAVSNYFCPLVCWFILALELKRQREPYFFELESNLNISRTLKWNSQAAIMMSPKETAQMLFFLFRPTLCSGTFRSRKIDTEPENWRETLATESSLVLILNLIGRKGGASFLDQQQIAVKEDQCSSRLISVLKGNWFPSLRCPFTLKTH